MGWGWGGHMSWCQVTDLPSTVGISIDLKCFGVMSQIYCVTSLYLLQYNYQKQ